MPMPAARASRAERKCTGAPSRRMVPSYSACTPAMIFISVLLPAPFSPTRPWISPAFRAKSTSLRACTPPNDLQMPDSSSSGAPPASMSFGSRTRSRSDQEVVLHPEHALRVRLGDDRAIRDDVLRDPARPLLLAGQHGRNARDHRTAMDPAGRVADGRVHASVEHGLDGRRLGIDAT